MSKGKIKLVVTIPVELRTDKPEGGYILTELIIVGRRDVPIQLVVDPSDLLEAARKIVPDGNVSIRRRL